MEANGSKELKWKYLQVYVGNKRIVQRGIAEREYDTESSHAKSQFPTVYYDPNNAGQVDQQQFC